MPVYTLLLVGLHGPGSCQPCGSSLEMSWVLDGTDLSSIGFILGFYAPFHVSIFLLELLCVILSTVTALLVVHTVLALHPLYLPTFTSSLTFSQLNCNFHRKTEPMLCNFVAPE